MSLQDLEQMGMWIYEARAEAATCMYIMISDRSMKGIWAEKLKKWADNSSTGTMAEIQRDVDAISAVYEQMMINRAIANSLVKETVESAMAKAIVAGLPLTKVKLMYPILAGLTIEEFRAARLRYMALQRELNEKA